MNDFVQTDKDNIRNEVLAKRIAETKEGDSGDMIVTHFDKLLMQEREEASIDTAKRMLAKGKLSVEEIAEYSSLPIEKVKELAKGA